MRITFIQQGGRLQREAVEQGQEGRLEGSRHFFLSVHVDWSGERAAGDRGTMSGVSVQVNSFVYLFLCVSFNFYVSFSINLI